MPIWNKYKCLPIDCNVGGLLWWQRKVIRCLLHSLCWRRWHESRRFQQNAENIKKCQFFQFYVRMDWQILCHWGRCWCTVICDHAISMWNNTIIGGLRDHSDVRLIHYWAVIEERTLCLCFLNSRVRNWSVCADAVVCVIIIVMIDVSKLLELIQKWSDGRLN